MARHKNSSNRSSRREDSADELTRARELVDRMTREAERNTQILKRSQQRELRLLEAEDLEQLSREILIGLRDSYALDTVSLVICDGSHDIRHLLHAGGVDPDDIPGLIFVESLAGMAPQYVALRRPWLGAFGAPDHGMLFPGVRRLASIAMIPLTHKRGLIGSINFGSRQTDRFTADHATDFFSHLGVIASFCLENVVNRARLMRSGFTDVLTGSYNRRYLQTRLGEELARARRHGTTLTCLMLDIDHFKRVNDSYGHAAGDSVLREVAHRIESEVRASDVAARYGGEEFVILLPETQTGSGECLAERIRATVAREPFDLGKGRQIDVTASIGIATVAPGQDDADLKTLGDALIARADVALYRAQAAGRNALAISNDEGEVA